MSGYGYSKSIEHGNYNKKNYHNYKSKFKKDNWSDWKNEGF